MSESIRIRTTPNGSDSSVTIKIEQDFDFIEILSLKISQAEAYSRFCSDYGVVVGRVIINDGFGVPNAKVSIFVPINEEDELDSELVGLYPYKTLVDKNSDGIRYNLLQKDAKPSENCFTSVGSFPTKREVIDNDTTLEVYDKYYKFTTTTNDAGDFMLFGIPVGSHILNMDADLSDIGIASQRPYDYISQGESIKRFESPTKFKADKDLDKLIQIKSYSKGVNVQPFWGDKDQCDIGITRVDFDIKKKIIPSAIFMGSLFSDSEKNSLNKNCRPRKDLGRLCETATSEGTVEMIRKTLDGTIERFDVEGGRVVNDAGAWAYQVPMNLDYMVTDEFGNLVPSDDPNKGIPTRARVRFRIGMDVTGDEGRLRTSAKYLVPHNPPNSSAIDYNFNENTSDEHFRDFHWNKIYTVSNFIPRIQPICSGDKCADSRAITGIKDVDDCTGLKTPFPYNRVDTDFNPLFLILCIILNIIIFIVWMINAVIVNLINVVLVIINAVLKVICKIVFFIAKIACYLNHLTNQNARAACRVNGCIGDCATLPECDDCVCKNILSYVPCIVMECDDKEWAPGCKCEYIDPASISVGSNDYGNTDIGAIGCWASKTNATNPKDPLHWSGLNYVSNSCGSSPTNHSGHNTIGAGLSDCYAIQLAEALDMFELDFYNDWINGTLYTYLLKYKKKKNGKQKFCDSDCDTPDSDNGCDKSWFVDTCISNGPSRIDIKRVTKKSIDEGFIKQVTTTKPDGKVEETLYYAPYAKNDNYKLFATELIHLGSVFSCDWEGIPKIQPHLIPTSYKRPPYTAEYLDDDTTKITCGMTSTGGGGTGGLFFDIDCIGLRVGGRCDNLKRICEIGVDIDVAQLDANNNVILAADCDINDGDIVNPFGYKFRDIFYALNINDGPTKLDSWPVGGVPVGGYGTEFDGSNVEYLQFRGAGISHTTPTPDPSTGNYTQPKNSYYFYFGTEPGRSSLETMNNRFFTECVVVQKNDFSIQGIVTDSTTPSGCTGEINITVVGGSGDFTYVWTGPNGYTATESTGNGEDGDIQGLCAGIYTVVITDSDGGSSTTSFTVNAPVSFFCDVISSPAVQAGADGAIIINNVGGGTPTYYYSIDGGPLITMTGSFENIPKPQGTYVVVITDSAGNSCTNTITITTPPALNIAGMTTWTNTTCGQNNGTLTVTIDFLTLGGAPAYTYLITGPSTSTSSLNLTGLQSGTYTVTVTDSSPTPQVTTDTIYIAPSTTPIMSFIPDWFCWLAPNITPTISPSFNVTTNAGNYIIEWESFDAANNIIPAFSSSQSFLGGNINPTIVSPLVGPYQTNFKLTDSYGCVINEFIDLRGGQGYVPTTAMAIEHIPEEYCWIDGSPVQIYPQFLITADGPFTISWAGGSESFGGSPVPTYITLSTLVSVGNVNFTLTETTHSCSNIIGPINLTTGGPNVPSTGLLGIATQPTQIILTVAASGGWGPYTYRWFKGGIDMGILTPTHSISVFENGTSWACKITDTNGCFTYSNTVITI